LLHPFGDLGKSVETGSQSSLQQIYADSTAGNRIIGGGLSVLRALFELLPMTRLEQTLGGLRHGLLLELMRDKT